MAPDDMLRSYEGTWSVCARNWRLFSTLLPVIQSLNEPVHQNRLNRLKQFSAQTAEIYKLLNQNSLSDAWQSLGVERSQNCDLFMWWMNWFSAPVSPAVTELRKPIDSDWRLIWACVNQTLEWRAKWAVLFFYFVYVKRWADEGEFILFIRFRHSKHPCFISLLGALIT